MITSDILKILENEKDNNPADAWDAGWTKGIERAMKIVSELVCPCCGKPITEHKVNTPDPPPTT